MRVLLLSLLLIGAALAHADDSVEQRLRIFAGHDGKDCREPRNAPGISEPCLVKAFQDGRSAFWVSHERSRVAPYSLGIAVDPSRHVLVVSREIESSPLIAYQCLEPAVVQEFGRQRLRCRERWTPPSEEELPIAGPEVRRPRLLRTLTVSAAVCAMPDDERLQVEFIVGKDGKVKMVEVLVAPDGCDVQAAAAELESFTFLPARLNGEPVLASLFVIVSNAPEN